MPNLCCQLLDSSHLDCSRIYVKSDENRTDNLVRNNNFVCLKAAVLWMDKRMQYFLIKNVFGLYTFNPFMNLSSIGLQKKHMETLANAEEITEMDLSIK